MDIVDERLRQFAISVRTESRVLAPVYDKSAVCVSDGSVREASGKRAGAIRAQRVGVLARRAENGP